jgi:hypothetical protein
MLIVKLLIGLVKKITGNDRYGKLNKVVKIVMGSAILAIGFYMFYLGF